MLSLELKEVAHRHDKLFFERFKRKVSQCYYMYMYWAHGDLSERGSNTDWYGVAYCSKDHEDIDYLPLCMYVVGGTDKLLMYFS